MKAKTSSAMMQMSAILADQKLRLECGRLENKHFDTNFLSRNVATEHNPKKPGLFNTLLVNL